VADTITTTCGLPVDWNLSKIEVHVQQRQAGRQEVSDSCARAIAALWHGPRDPQLTELSTCGTVSDVSALLTEISLCRPYAVHESDILLLDMLSTWAINHPTREDV
jgi:hypothetical protein